MTCKQQTLVNVKHFVVSVSIDSAKGDITISVNSDVSPQLLMTVMRFLSNA